MTIHCDFEIGVTAGVHPCTAEVVGECLCPRCAHEVPEERFHACADHMRDAAARHASIRGREADWHPLPGKSFWTRL